MSVVDGEAAARAAVTSPRARGVESTECVSTDDSVEYGRGRGSRASGGSPRWYASTAGATVAGSVTGAMGHGIERAGPAARMRDESARMVSRGCAVVGWPVYNMRCRP